MDQLACVASGSLGKGDGGLEKREREGSGKEKEEEEVFSPLISVYRILQLRAINFNFNPASAGKALRLNPCREDKAANQGSQPNSEREHF